MWFDRCVYHIPQQAQKDYWEDVWAGKPFDVLVEGMKRKQWYGRLVELAAAVPDDGLILEAGCGSGALVFLLHQMGKRVRGVDFAEETIARTRREHPELDLAAADVCRLPLADGSVSLYISLGVVEHDPAGPSAILREAARVLADDGLLFINVPYFNLYRRLREPWWRVKYAIRRWIGQPLLGLSPLVFYQYAMGRAELDRLLERAGFEVLSHAYCHTHVAITKDLAGNWLVRRLCRNPKAPQKLHSGRLMQLADRIDRLGPHVLSHMLVVTARRCRRPVRTRI
jgi:SAM-dependent methyltransferase